MQSDHQEGSNCHRDHTRPTRKDVRGAIHDRVKPLTNPRFQLGNAPQSVLHRSCNLVLLSRKLTSESIDKFLRGVHRCSSTR